MAPGNMTSSMVGILLDAIAVEEIQP